MRRTLVAPASYVQGPDVLSNEDAVYDGLRGETALVLGGETALSTVRDRLVAGLDAAGIETADVVAGVDTCTFDRIDELAARGRDRDADVVVGVGGGVALDSSKGVAAALDAELVTVPTVASTDAPCSSVAVVYDADGGFDGYVRRGRNPELVVVDTAVVASAPARFLRMGMGDAFATRFEAEAVARSGATAHAGGVSTDAALTLARRSYGNLERHGSNALAAVSRDSVTPAVERVVETNTLLSGLGFESSGLAGAHAFSKGFSRAGVKQPHGQLVAFGAIAQLVLEDGTEAEGTSALDDALSLARELGLDRTLDDLGVTPETVETVAEHACADDTTMSNEPVPVTPRSAADALRTADELLS